MSIGDLRNKIELERLKTVAGEVPQDNTGREIKDWEKWRDAWAKIAPMSGAARFAQVADQPYSYMDTVITIRYVEGVKSTMRVKHGDDYYSIEAIRDLNNRHVTLELICKSWNDAEENNR